MSARGFFLGFIFFLTGCASDGSGYASYWQKAIGAESHEEAIARLKKLSYASNEVFFQGRAKGFLVLGSARQNNLSWYAPKQFLETRYGRVIKASGLGTEPEFAEGLENDPLQKPLLLTTFPVSWQWRKDVLPGNWYQVRGVSEFRNLGDAPLKEFPDNKLQLIEEQFSVPVMTWSEKNLYWVDGDSGRIVRSKQYLHPDFPPLWITEVLPFIEK